MVSKQVREVVGVLVLAAPPEGQRLHGDEGRGAAHPDLATSLFPEEGPTCKRDLHPVAEGEPQARRNHGCEVVLDILDATADLLSVRRRNQEVHRHLRGTVDLPPLAGLVPLLVGVGAEPRGAQALGQGLVATVIEDGDGQAHVEIRRAHVLLPGCLLIDEKARHEPANDHDLIEEVPELRGDVEAGSAHVTDEGPIIPAGSSRLGGHRDFQFRRRDRSSPAASVARSG